VIKITFCHAPCLTFKRKHFSWSYTEKCTWPSWKHHMLWWIYHMPVCCVSVILYWHNFKSSVGLVAGDIDTTLNNQLAQVFTGLMSIQEPVLSGFSLVKAWCICVYFFIQHWTRHLKFFTYSVHSFILHCWCIFCTNLLLLFPVMYTVKLYFKWTLYLQQNTFHTLSARSLAHRLACSLCPLLCMAHNMWLSVCITLLHL